MPEEPQDHELSRLQAALRRLTPRPANIDRDRVLYEAGRAATRGGRLWHWATFGMTVLASCLAMALVLHSAAEPVHQFVHVPAPVPQVQPAPAPLLDEAREVLAETEPAAPAPEPDPYSYLRMHQAAMATESEPTVTPRESLTPRSTLPRTPMTRTPQRPIPTAGTRNYAATLAVTGDY